MDSVLGATMAEVVLNDPQVVALVGEVEAEEAVAGSACVKS